jgi:hypothetical protein
MCLTCLEHLRQVSEQLSRLEKTIVCLHSLGFLIPTRSGSGRESHRDLCSRYTLDYISLNDDDYFGNRLMFCPVSNVLLMGSLGSMPQT